MFLPSQELQLVDHVQISFSDRMDCGDTSP